MAEQQPIAIPNIPGLTVTNSGNLLGPDTKIAQLIWAPAGYGKTYLAGQLDALTQKYGMKRSLIIAVEQGEGGGAATLRKSNVPLYSPKDYNDLFKTLGTLRNDKAYGGIVLDSASELVKQYVRPTALKYPCRENVPTRAAGVPTRSDYQVMGELTSQIFRQLMGFTTHENPEYRKHLIITAADQTREEDERITWVGPDLPGRMSREAVQMFQQVGTITIKAEVVKGTRTNARFLTFAPDGVKALKDRYDIFPQEIRLSGPNSPEGETLVSIYEKYWLQSVAA